MTIAEIADHKTDALLPLQIDNQLVPSFINLDYPDKQRLFVQWQIAAPGVSPEQQHEISLVYSGFLGFDDDDTARLIRAAENVDPFALPEQHIIAAQHMVDDVHRKLFTTSRDYQECYGALMQIQNIEPKLLPREIGTQKLAHAGGVVMSSMIDTVASTLWYSDYAVPTFQLFSASARRVAFELCQQNGEK